MAKKKNAKDVPGDASAASSADPRMAELERNWQAGNYIAARRLAHAVLQDSTSRAEDQGRARELLGMMAVDRVPLAVFVGMLLVLAIVFVNGIVVRNRALKEAPPSIELNKQLAPAPAAPPGTVPAEGSGDVPPR